MSLLKSLGLSMGTAVGTVIGGTLKTIGMHSRVKLAETIGTGIQKTSIFAGESLGHATSGTFDLATGIITQNAKHVDQGIADISQALGKTKDIVAGTVECFIDVLDGVSSTFGHKTSTQHQDEPPLGYEEAAASLQSHQQDVK